MWDTSLFIVLTLLAIPPGMLVLYPVALRMLRRSSSVRAPMERLPATRSVALVTVCNRLDDKLERKLVEFAELGQRSSVIERHVGLDGVAPPTIAKDPTITWTSICQRQGKNALLKRIHEKSHADVLVFTDVDASVAGTSLDRLLDRFDDPDVGAVTGRRAITDETRFGQAQAAYTGLDNQIRHLEMACFGSVTSCDGKLYAIRRTLLTGLPTDVTDDLFTGLGAVAAGRRLVFEPCAIARIGRPARDWRHEMVRRRRVTCRGLSTLWHRRSVLDPRTHGGYALALFINKGLRRLAAPCVLVGSALLLAIVTGKATAEGVQSLSALAIGLLILCVGLALVWRSRRGAVLYLLLGTVGMSLGVLDYLCGRRVSVWIPTKASDGRHETS